MRKFIIALAATTALAAAAPAAAQYGGNAQLSTNQLQAQIQAGVRNGTISRAQAMPLRDQLRQLSQLERQYARGGFSAQERRDLQRRSTYLQQQIRIAVRTDDGRYDRDDRYGDDRYGRDCPPGLDKRNNGCLPPGQVGRDDRWNEQDRYGRNQIVDRNRDGFDDRDLNRDGRIDDREWRIAQERYGNDGRYDSRDRRDDDRYDRGDDRGDDRYDNRDAPRSGVGGVIGNILGGGGLRVGQRVSGNLGAVPHEYRNQYRDGNGVYYRSDNRAIYQIDARTHTVVRVYALNR